MHTNGLAAGVRLFNEGEFFEAHEVLEDVWRASAGEEKTFLQGLVQLAVAFHHYSTGNKIGTASVLARARRNLEGYPAVYGGVDLGLLLTALQKWQEAFQDGLPPGPFPQIQFHPDGQRPD